MVQGEQFGISNPSSMCVFPMLWQSRMMVPDDIANAFKREVLWIPNEWLSHPFVDANVYAGHGVSPKSTILHWLTTSCGCIQDLACYVGDEALLTFLQDVAKIESFSLIYIASGANKLSQTCKTYNCFTRHDVWQPEKSLLPHADQDLVKAYMDFLIAQLAHTFIGNRLSTFSMELFHLFNDAGKQAMFVNKLKCPNGKKVSYTGCKPVNFMDCCV